MNKILASLLILISINQFLSASHFQSVLVSGYLRNKMGPNQQFFFSVPFTHDTYGEIDKSNKKINFEYRNYKNDLANFSAIKKNSKLVEENENSKELFTFTENYSKLQLNLDVLEDKFNLEIVRYNGNQIFKTIHLKFTNKKTPNFFINVRLSFAVTTSTPSERSEWIKFLTCKEISNEKTHIELKPDA